MLYKTSNRTHVLYLQIFNIQNYILFKVTASGSVFSRYSQTSRKPPHKIRRFFGRLNENRTTEGLTRKGPNTVTFWVSSCYDMTKAWSARDAFLWRLTWNSLSLPFQTPAKQATICVVSCLTKTSSCSLSNVYEHRDHWDHAKSRGR